MTEKELKKMSRSELLEMLIMQTEQNNTLKKALECAEKELENRSLLIHNAGSIAEATIQLHGVFEVAEAAAQEYLRHIRDLESRQEARCRELEEEARKKADEIITEAQAYSDSVRSEADAYWKQICEKKQAASEKRESLQFTCVLIEGEEVQ